MADERTLRTRDEHDGGVLSRVSTEMVRLTKEYFGRGPDQAKSYMLDDFLVVVMRGGLIPAEKTLLEAGQPDLVRNFRQQFQNEMTRRLTDMVEQETGRRVVNYQSQVLFDPDIIMEIFFFEEPVTSEAVRTTAHGQLGEDAVGEERPS